MLSPDTGGNNDAKDGRNTEDATNINGNGNGNGNGTGNRDDHKPNLRQVLSAYIRKIKPSSCPELGQSPNDGNATGKQEEQAQQASRGEERRESGVALAAKRVARRKRQEKADQDARIQVQVQV